MKALITGASSGIGRDMARSLAERGVELVLVARRADRLMELAAELPVKAEVLAYDLSQQENCIALYERLKGGVDVLINCAGFGLCGRLAFSELEEELRLIDTNIRALHILTKLFVQEFRAKDRGWILNVASFAAFFPGPKMAAYYASKGYVLRLTEALYEELRREKSKVKVSVLCPGPVRTEFNEVADVRFSLKSLSSQYVAEYALRGLFEGKLLIIPGAGMKAMRFLSRFAGEKLLLRSIWNLQK